VYVTHDQSEALALSDRIAVMNHGRVSQLGTPQEIYDHPADPFVADFIGSSNFLKGRVCGDAQGGRLAVELPGGQRLMALCGKTFAAGTAVLVALRPERLGIHAARPSGDGQNLVQARLTGRSYLGARTLYQVDVGGTALRIESDVLFNSGEVWVEIPEASCVLFPAEGCDLS
jgi:iron(III) transport system ATP-binding protein